jgi:hypothetical protein
MFTPISVLEFSVIGNREQYTLSAKF